MDQEIRYAFRIDRDTETPCHISELKNGDVFYMVQGGQKSNLLIATGDAFSSDVNGQLLWSIPHEIYE
jgi:hypothetical protein